MDWLNKIVDFLPFIKNGNPLLKVILILWLVTSFFLIFNYISFKSSKNYEKELQDKINNEAINYSKFIDKLASNSETIRNSAVIELGEILNKNEKYHNKIIKILISHINEQCKELIKDIDNNAIYKPKQDVQNSFIIIGKRNTSNDNDELIFNFNDLDLNGLSLKGLDFAGFDFAGSQFVRSKLIDCNLDKSELHNINFCYADLSGSSIKNSRVCASLFYFSKLLNCNFENSHLGGSQFKHLSFEGSSFQETSMFSTLFETVDFSKSINLNKNKMIWAYGSKVNLPEGFVLRKEPLLTVNNGNGKGIKNRLPFVTGIGNEEETLKFLLRNNK